MERGITNITAADFEPKTEQGRMRAEAIRTLRREGVVPDWWATKATVEVDNAIPSEAVRNGYAGGWSRVWRRPHRSDWSGSDQAFEALTVRYDQDEGQAEHADNVRTQRQEKEATATRQRQEADAAQREQEADQVKAELRSQYLRMSGTTSESFEREYPALLQDHRRREMERLDREGEAARQEMRQIIRQYF